MIEFFDKASFLASGLGFTDLFEEALFHYYLKKDGKLLYNPTDSFMYSVDGVKAFFVEQAYLGNRPNSFFS